VSVPGSLSLSPLSTSAKLSDHVHIYYTTTPEAVQDDDVDSLFEDDPEDPEETPEARKKSPIDEAPVEEPVSQNKSCKMMTFTLYSTRTRGGCDSLR
jgi:hypothetical protein